MSANMRDDMRHNDNQKAIKDNFMHLFGEVMQPLAAYSGGDLKSVKRPNDKGGRKTGKCA